LTSRFYNYLLTKHALGKPGLDYFSDTRKLTLPVINSFMLGYAPANGTVLMEFLLKKGVSRDEMLQAGVIINKAESSGYSDKFREELYFP
jgi:DNA primase